MTTAATSLEVHLDPADLGTALRRDVREGLTSTPKRLPPKYFYDARGSKLFEQITRLPEYYPTRTERAILERHAPAIARVAGADTLVELGSGSSEKTRLLLDAAAAAGTLRSYLPVDVSPAALKDALEQLARDYPGVELRGVVADFERHLDRLPSGGRRMVVFLGSTIGNFESDERRAFLRHVRSGMAEGDTLLLGTDLVKDPARLVAAYDDAAGVTADFNRNVLRVLNRELGADFDAESFVHVARWNAELEQMEMWLRAPEQQTVRVADLGLEVIFAEGEEMRTEVSAKFRPDRLARELASGGFQLLELWTDPARDFALTLSAPD